ncbi:hypothetical protein [Methylobacterium oryzisoli]|uniref:hypothetical protein n=1 Tax=Methylobacterium oryzisoli TaxID=3385502 RepID=UPI0038929FFF
MDDAEKLAATEAYQVILTKAAETLRAARRTRPVLTVEQGERAALQVALAELVSLYICDPAAIGGNDGAAWILNRILATLGSASERQGLREPTLH